MSYQYPRIQATNVPDSPDVDGSIPSATDAAVRSANIQSIRDADANIEAAAGTMQSADAQREMPRARTDNLNENAGRHLTDEGDAIETPSVFSHRMNRRNANRGINRFNSAQKRVAGSFINPQNDQQREIRDLVNAHFENGGKVADMSPRAQQYVRQLDGAIQKAERENDRQHVVYAPVTLPGNLSKDDFISAVRSGSRLHQNLLGYTRANHDINKVNPTPDEAQDNNIYVQIETSRGMYVGNEGGTGHLLPRGLELELVNTGEFDVDDGNGQTTKKTVIQMREVRQNERTKARE